MKDGISKLNLKDFDEYLAFYQKAYPSRANARARFLWQCIENPILEDKKNPYVFLYRKNGRIAGHSISNPIKWHYQGNSHMGYMNYDWYVLGESRGAAGLALAMTAADLRPYFGIGFSEIAEKIWLGLGVQKIGKISVFVWVRPAKFLSSLLTSLKRKESYRANDMPNEIMSSGIKFRLVNQLESWSESHWRDILDFSRPIEYLKWRFFSPTRRYYFFLSTNCAKPVYFVLREGRLSKSLSSPFWVLVDYRVPYMNRSAFDAILNASKEITKRTAFCGIITGSSHNFFDRCLKRNFFLNTTKGNLIMTNADIGIAGERGKARNFVYATLADSDVEISAFE